MDLIKDNLKPGIGNINAAIRKVFSSKGVQVDDITWNPYRGSLVNDRFSVHSIRVTVSEWQKTLYGIETADILDYAAGNKPVMITLRIKELAEIYNESSSAPTWSLDSSFDTDAGKHNRGMLKSG